MLLGVRMNSMFSRARNFSVRTSVKLNCPPRNSVQMCLNRLFMDMLCLGLVLVLGRLGLERLGWALRSTVCLS